MPINTRPVEVLVISFCVCSINVLCEHDIIVFFDSLVVYQDWQSYKQDLVNIDADGKNFVYIASRHQ